jgi:2-keto-4-pentenoate hydratase/2-oxohepta-3-ene-1,7-dioic acid hydratase in catechol pathway
VRLGTLRTERGPRVVAVTGRGWLDVGRALGWGDGQGGDLRAVIAQADETLPRIREAVAAVERGEVADVVLHPADEERLLPPIPNPRRILCIGFNYVDHAAEMRAALPKAPEVFLRIPSTLVGPRDDVWLPPESEEVDLEAELAVVIGRGGRRIPRERALDAVFGWSVFNDVSVRDYQRRGSQWTPGKNFERTAPFGPFVVTRDELPDPVGLEVSSAIDDVDMQRSDTSHLLFDIPTLIADLSTFTTLEPGDIIATGTPPGVGQARTPPRWVRAGEVMHCRVAGVGELRNRLVPEPGARR